MTDRERRLPKWAQTEIANLRREVRRLRERIEGEEPPDSNTFAHDYGGMMGALRQGLGKSPKISFYQSADTDDWNTRVDIHVDENGWIKVYGGRSLVVLPESSNTLRLRSQ